MPAWEQHVMAQVHGSLLPTGGGPDGVLGLWLQPGPAPVALGIWLVN